MTFLAPIFINAAPSRPSGQIDGEELLGSLPRTLARAKSKWRVYPPPPEDRLQLSKRSRVYETVETIPSCLPNYCTYL